MDFIVFFIFSYFPSTEVFHKHVLESKKVVRLLFGIEKQVQTRDNHDSDEENDAKEKKMI